MSTWFNSHSSVSSHNPQQRAMASGTMRQAMAASACCALRRAPTRRCCATAAVAPNSVPPMLLTMVAEQPRGARGFAAGGVAERQHGRACVVGVRPGGRDLLQPMQCVSGASAGRRTPAPCMWVRASSSDAGAGDGDGDGRGSGGRRPRRRRAQGVRVAHSAQQKGFPTPKTVYCSYLPYEWVSLACVWRREHCRMGASARIRFDLTLPHALSTHTTRHPPRRLHSVRTS